MNTTSVIDISDVNFSYASVPVLENISFTVNQGDFTALIGPNGGGKTTLIKIILGLLKPDNGVVRIFGGPVKRNQQRLGYVPQYAQFNADFPISVQDTVLQGRLGTTRWWGGYTTSDREKANQVMKETEIFHLKHRSIGSLSGGQLQRVMVARALAGEPELLLLDEPTANIDQRSEKDIFDLFKDLNHRMTIMVISHDIGFVSEYINTVLCLNRTLVCHESKPVTSDTIHELYGNHVSEIHHRH